MSAIFVVQNKFAHCCSCRQTLAQVITVEIGCVTDDFVDLAPERRKLFPELGRSFVGDRVLIKARYQAYDSAPRSAWRGGVVSGLDARCSEVKEQARERVGKVGRGVNLDVRESWNGHRFTR